MNLPAIRCRYQEHLPIGPEAVRRCLEGHFRGLLHGDRPAGHPSRRGHGVGATESEPLARLLTRTILDTARARPITGCSEANRATIETRIARFIGQDAPVAAQMLWSPRKHWVTGSESAVDLAELAALDTLRSVRDAVRDVHPPGMTFRLDVEDLEFEFIEGAAPEVVEARNRYIHGLRRLVDVLGLDEVISVVRISEKAADIAELDRWRAQMTDNYRALETYWCESERVGIERGDRLPSYQALCELGWRGSIPAEMRRHYLNRLRGLPEAQEPAKAGMVLRNLAGILLHHQKGIVSGPPGSEPVKFSFVPPARGAPAELLTGRVDLRFVPRRLCSRVSAAGPWSTKGFLRRHGDQLVPAFVGWHEARAAGARFVEGALTLERDGEAANVRADYLIG